MKNVLCCTAKMIIINRCLWLGYCSNPLFLLLSFCCMHVIVVTAKRTSENHDDDCNPRFSYSGRLIVHEIADQNVNNAKHKFIVFIMPISSAGSNSSCGMLNFNQVLATEALLFAQRTFSLRFPEQQPLGVLILDSCSMQDTAIRDTVNFETCSLRFASMGHEILASQTRLYTTIGTEKFNDNLLKAMKVFEKPVFALRNEELEIQYPMDFLEDISTFTNQVMSLIHLLKQLDYKFVGVLYSASTRSVEMYRAFQHIVEDVQFNICYDPYMAPESDDIKDTRHLLKSITVSQPNLQILISLTNSKNTKTLFHAAKQLKIMDKVFWIAFTSSLHEIHNPSLIPKNGLYLMDSRYLTEFKSSFFPEAAAYTGLQHNPWLFDYLNCSKWDAWMCRSRLSQFPLEVWLMQGARIQRLIDTYDLLSLAAQDPIHTNLTVSLTVAQLIQSRAQDAKEAVSELSIYALNKIDNRKLTTVSDADLEHTPKVHHNLFKWQFIHIGSVKHTVEHNGTRISLLIKKALMPESSPTSAYCTGSCTRCPPDSIRTTQADNLLQVYYTQSVDVLPDWINHRNQEWAMIVTGLSAGQLLIVIIYEIFTLFKLCTNIGKAPPLIQSSALLSQLLLFSIFLLTLGVCTYTLNPTVLLCIIQRFLVSCSLCLCYGCLFVKLLLVVNSNGVPACFNQTVLILLLILIQVSVCVQWTLYEKPKLKGDGQLGCQLSHYDLVRIYAFPILVLLTTNCTAVFIRESSVNHYEAIFVLTVAVFNTFIWAAFFCVELLTEYEWIKEASPAISLLLAAFLTFVAMFFPRSRQKIAIAESNEKPVDPQEDILAWCANSRSNHMEREISSGEHSTRPVTATNKSSPQSGSTCVSDQDQLRIRIPDLDRSQPGTTYVPSSPFTSRRPVLVMPHLRQPLFSSEFSRVSLFQQPVGGNNNQSSSRFDDYPAASQITLDAPFSQTRPAPPPPPPINLFKGAVLNQAYQKNAAAK